MSSNMSFQIRFESCTIADRNALAEALRRDLLDVNDVEVSIKRDDATTMDFGGTLVLVLGTPAVIALARALDRFLSRNNQAAVTITTANGRVVAQNVDSENAAKIVASALTTELRQTS